MVTPPSVKGSGGARSAIATRGARFAPNSEAILRGASALPPAGLAGVTNAVGGIDERGRAALPVPANHGARPEIRAGHGECEIAAARIGGSGRDRLDRRSQRTAAQRH